MSDTWTDEIGRIFCEKHRRETCHVCCMDFGIMNRQYEVNAGLRKPPSEIETLAEQRTTLRKGIEFMQDNKFDPKHPNLVFHEKELKSVEGKLAKLQAQGKSAEINVAIRAAELKAHSAAMELEAIAGAWKAENPGKSKMEYGGPDTQRLYDKVAAPPPSSILDAADKHTCSYCSKSSATKLMCCGRCKKTYYCDKTCQAAAWKGHKKECREYGSDPADSTNKDSKPKQLPLTWDQLEAYEGMPATGKVLEVRIMKVDSFMRLVLHCKDRAGVVRIIAVYTEDEMLPGALSGRILRWKNPRFHYFLDGQGGCRVEDYDLKNIKITDN